MTTKKKKKSKMGRPPVDNPRQFRLAVRVTLDEKNELQRLADAAGVNLSEFLMLPYRKRKGSKS